MFVPIDYAVCEVRKASHCYGIIELVEDPGLKNCTSLEHLVPSSDIAVVYIIIGNYRYRPKG